MGKEQLYECGDVKSIKQICDTLEILWEHIPIPPVGMIINSLRYDPSITITIEDIECLKSLLASDTMVNETSTDIWIHNPEFVVEGLEDNKVSISFHWYKPSVTKEVLFNKYLKEV